MLKTKSVGSNSSFGSTMSTPSGETNLRGPGRVKSAKQPKQSNADDKDDENVSKSASPTRGNKSRNNSAKPTKKKKRPKTAPGGAPSHDVAAQSDSEQGITSYRNFAFEFIAEIRNHSKWTAIRLPRQKMTVLPSNMFTSRL